jgi:hypothetical protein
MFQLLFSLAILMTENEQFVVRTFKTSLNRYLVFDKLSVLKDKLYKGELRVCYTKTLNTFPKIKLTKVSNDFIVCLMDLYNNKEHFDMSLFMKLNMSENKLMLILLGDSGYGQKISFDEVEAYKNRMKVLQGELQVGNDNQEILKEALNVVKRLRALNAITILQARELIESLED